ncbi:ribitol kinase [Nadsonia fulvescens var. elongata DSM 6958]|uniref:Ribitol kinase n=1 Tax=Nadsonia fulvescens var. elongata DSM 6958 TaxID=857566 RepID=A0A1E3PFP0_9ASCO|nr:ribitol kinase [Nadsonia fulvescens var. elongata DSM 6958]
MVSLVSSTHYLGIDVGTGSARACVINDAGEILALESREITRWEPKSEYFNQSSNEIWDAICACTKKAVVVSNVDVSSIKGLAFDATCSLVALNEQDDSPVAVGPDFSENDQNIILWMDHRALDQTNAINATGHPLLKFVGGKMSIEMEIPKVKWLKENMDSAVFKNCKFYDLPDFLTHKATGFESRSYCSTVCKQGFVPVGVDGSVTGWDKEFLTSIGLEDLTEDDFRRLGGVHGKNGHYTFAGETVGNLTPKAAAELGLHEGVLVGSGVIDAYSGWIGTVAAKSGDEEVAQPKITSSDDDMHLVANRLAAVAGTSTCHLVMSKEPVFVPGVWGPYRDVIFPDYWLAEGGQSATGELLHYVLINHPAYAEALLHSTSQKISVFEFLNNRLLELKKERNAPSVTYLAKHLFFYGDFHGNRSPIADPSMKGAVIGKNMDVSIDALAIEYLAAVEFIGQQTRHIVETMNKSGHKINQIYLSGGQCRNKILTQIMANCTGMPVIMPRYIEAAVVLGTAMLGAKAASQNKRSLWSIMTQMSGQGAVVKPEQCGVSTKLLDTKYKIFLDMASTQQKYRALVDEAMGDN